jgi:hypothetical protein
MHQAGAHLVGSWSSNLVCEHTCACASSWRICNSGVLQACPPAHTVKSQITLVRRDSPAQGEAEGSFDKKARIPPRGGAEDSVEFNAGNRPNSMQRGAVDQGDESVQ